MIETAIEITGGKIPASVFGEILAAGRDMLRHPVETLPHVRETLEQLAGDYRMILITKGDLFDQERKLAQSGLGELFDAVEIVSEKNAATYERIFSRHGDGPSRSMMVGNSLKSDIVPAIAGGQLGGLRAACADLGAGARGGAGGGAALPAPRASRRAGRVGGRAALIRAGGAPSCRYKWRRAARLIEPHDYIGRCRVTGPFKRTSTMPSNCSRVNGLARSGASRNASGNASRP